jgi:hypothetical protein
MLVNLVGIQNYDKVKLDDGGEIDGVKIHFNYRTPVVKGTAVEAKYIPRETLSFFDLTYDTLESRIGTDINVDYGPMNKIVGLSVVAPFTPPQTSQGKLK